ncbi:MAG: insulinase family protein [Thermoanaerobaculales bacterium]|nr:insulinase family protein [Thermoanaerobaculales bacterium]
MSRPEAPNPPALLVQPVPGRRTIAAGIWITRGAAHDPSSLAGATHLVEHLTLRSCGGRSRHSLALAIDRLGGEVDAWTSSELMGVSINTTVDAVDEALDLIVDAVTSPTFAPDDVALELRVTQAELELVEDDPADQVEEAMLRAAWGRHPLARPVIGTRESLARLTPVNLRRHHQTLLRPGGMLAAVVGDVEPAAVAARLARLPLALPAQPPPLPALRWRGSHLDLSREGTEQVHARLGFEALAAGDPRVTALVILNRCLGDGAASRLFQRLREDEGLTYDVWSGPVLRRLGGLLEIGWACAPAAFADALRLIREELARIARDLEDGEVEAAREGLARGLEMDLESPGGLCTLDVGEVLDRGRRFDPEAARRELAAVTVAEVRDLAAELLRPERMASAVSGPEGAAIRVA